MKCVEKAAHHVPSKPSVPTNFGKHCDFYVTSQDLTASRRVLWCASDTML